MIYTAGILNIYLEYLTLDGVDENNQLVFIGNEKDWDIVHYRVDRLMNDEVEIFNPHDLYDQERDLQNDLLI